VLIGTAGWSIPKAQSAVFTGDGPHLHRYAQVLSCAEINSSFYRRHSSGTYRKWASLTPATFKFSVKLPSLITHEQRLRRARVPLQEFLADVAGMGRKLGPLLIQLPPSLEFTATVARSFFTMLREEFGGAVVCEPRHASWFSNKAEKILLRFRIGRVATDPTRIDSARAPGGWMISHGSHGGSVAYYRLHGSPRKYWSSYERSKLEDWAAEVADLPSSVSVWCIFDNTASGAALANALELRDLLERGVRERPKPKAKGSKPNARKRVGGAVR
jgi:uncharacterized protein YecE (DUF72 family)